jgi:hypothetical protein
MADPPASGWAMRGTGMVLMSLVTVDPLLVLLLDESFCATADTVMAVTREVATQRENACRRRRDNGQYNDLGRKGTIGIRRSHKV